MNGEDLYFEINEWCRLLPQNKWILKTFTFKYMNDKDLYFEIKEK